MPLAAFGLVLAATTARAQDILDLRGGIENQNTTLEELQTPVPAAQAPSPQDEAQRVQPVTKQEPQSRLSRVLPIGPRTDLRSTEDDAFAPVGLRVGSFILRPSVETGLLATTNASSSPDGDDAIVSESTLRLNAISDWAIDQAELNAFGTFEKSLSGEELDQKEAGIDVAVIRELSNDYRLRGFASYAIRPESFDSPVEVTGAVDQPIQQSFIASADLSREAGKLQLGIGVDADREWYGDAELADGTEVSQSDRDNTLSTGRLRLGYEFSPMFVPFAELRAGIRSYEEATDAAGYDRSGDHLEANAGFAFDRGEKFRGELALGYVRENLDDDRLSPIAGLNLSADINWSPVRGTNLNFLGNTVVEGTTTPGLSGSILYSGLLTVERQMRSNLTGHIAGGIGYRDYQPSSDYDMIYSAEAATTWWLNRNFGLVARVRHENVNSTIPDRDSTTNSVYFGVKAQQ